MKIWIALPHDLVFQKKPELFELNKADQWSLWNIPSSCRKAFLSSWDLLRTSEKTEPLWILRLAKWVGKLSIHVELATILCCHRLNRYWSNHNGKNHCWSSHKWSDTNGTILSLFGRKQCLFTNDSTGSEDHIHSLNPVHSRALTYIPSISFWLYFSSFVSPRWWHKILLGGLCYKFITYAKLHYLCSGKAWPQQKNYIQRGQACLEDIMTLSSTSSSIYVFSMTPSELLHSLNKYLFFVEYYFLWYTNKIEKYIATRLTNVLVQ